MKGIKIVVEGAQDAGKSRIARFLRDLMRHAGFEVTSEDEGSIAALSDKTPIQIVTRQTRARRKKGGAK